MVVHPCGLGINEDCLKAYPLFGVRAIAYRVLWKVLPGRVVGFLGMGLEGPLIGAGVVLPLGVDFPGGWVVFPDVVFPDGWDLGDPLPAGVFAPPEFSPLMADSGGSEPLFVGLLGGGPVHGLGGVVGARWSKRFAQTYWQGVVVPGYELESIRWVVDHWRVYYAGAVECTTWGTLEPKTGSTWAVGYRPSKCRVTFLGGTAPIKIGLCDTGNNSLGHNLNAISPVVISLTFTAGLDIGRLNVGNANVLISNIEFS